MLARFCLYSVFKNLRFADPFLVLYLLDLECSYAEIGLLLGFERLVVAAFEVPSGVVADFWGRRKSVAACFLFYAASFLVFPMAADRAPGARLAWLYAAAALFALGEAMRTGGHKAIMLDWLDQRGESDRATRVIAVTRSFSKASAAVSAAAGGLVLWKAREYGVLFHLSAVSALAGFVLMLTYPAELEGEHARAGVGRKGGEPLRILPRFAGLAAAAGILPLFLQSIVFESQVKLLLDYYVQPFLKEGLEARGVVILGAGALWVGVNQLVNEGVGSAGAWFAPDFERRCGGAAPALRRAYLAVAALSVAIGACQLRGWMIAGLLALVGVTLLQNLRRPVFVGAFNRVMDKPHRATSLSIESQARSLFAAGMLPVTGLVADRWGLDAVFPMIAAVLLLGLLAGPRRRALADRRAA
jgi:MFS family permease